MEYIRDAKSKWQQLTNFFQLQERRIQQFTKEQPNDEKLSQGCSACRDAEATFYRHLRRINRLQTERVFNAPLTSIFGQEKSKLEITEENLEYMDAHYETVRQRLEKGDSPCTVVSEMNEEMAKIK